MILGRQGSGIDEGPREPIGIAATIAPQAQRVVLQLDADRLLSAQAQGTSVAKGEHGLDAAGDIVREQADGAGRGDADEMAVADSRRGDGCAHVFRKSADKRSTQVRVALEEREGPLFLGESRRGAIGGTTDGAHGVCRLLPRSRIPVVQSQHDQGIRQARDSQPDPAGAAGNLGLAGKGVAGDIDQVVQHAHGNARQRRDSVQIQACLIGEGIAHELRQVDGPEIAGAVGRQRHLAARVGRTDQLPVAKVVLPVDPVDEEHPRLGAIMSGTGDGIPQVARPDAAQDAAGHRPPTTRPSALELWMVPGPTESRLREQEGPVLVTPHRLHEGIRDEHGEVEVSQYLRVALCLYECPDIRVVTAQGGHHGPTAVPTGDHGGAHGVP